MIIQRSSRLLFSCGLLGAALLASTAFAVSKEELIALRAKAESGNGIAQYNLGLVYADANEPIADPVEAYVWLNLAADNGATGRALILLTSQLTPEQVAEGKERLQKRRADIQARSRVVATANEKAAPAATAAAASSPVSAPAATSSTPVTAPANPVVSAQTDSLVSAPPLETKKLSSELANAWKENDQLKAQLAKMAQASEAAEQLKKERERLAGAMAAATDEVARLKATIANLEGERTALQQKLAATGVSASAAVQIEQLAAKLKAAEGDVAKANATAAELASAKQQLEEVHIKLESSLRSYDLQQKEIDKLQKALANIDAEREGLARQLEAARSAPPKSDSAAQQKISALTADLSAAQQERDVLRKGQADLTDSLARLKLANDQVASLRQQNDGLVKQLATAQTSSSVSSAEFNRLKMELADTQGRLSASESALAKAKSEKAPAPANNEEEIADLQSKLRATDSALASANADKATLQQQIATLQAPATADNSATVPRRELDETQTKLDAALRSYQLQQAEIDRLQKALANIDEERAQLSERLQQSTSQATSATAQAAVNSEATAQLSAAREQLRQSQNQIASLAAENAQLRNRLSLAGSPPASSLSAPTRPGTGAATQLVASTPASSASAVAEKKPETRIHTVAEGETLSRIAKRYYGSADRWNEILEANRDVIRDPKSISVGMKLKIP